MSSAISWGSSSSSLRSLVLDQAQVVLVFAVFALQEANWRRDTVHHPDHRFLVARLHARDAHRAVAQFADFHVFDLAGNVIAVVAYAPVVDEAVLQRLARLRVAD